MGVLIFLSEIVTAEAFLISWFVGAISELMYMRGAVSA